MSGLDAAAGDWPGWVEFLRVLSFRGGYNTSLVLLGVTLLGAAAGVVGSFALLRRRALMSDVLSHATLPGLCLAFLGAALLGLSGRSLPVLLAGAAASGVLGVLAVQALTSRTRLPEDAAMGAVLSSFFGLGFVLLSLIQTLGTGDEGGIAKFVYGQTAAMATSDALAILVVAVLAVLAAAAFFKEFRLACFDPEFARAQGFATDRIDLAMMALVVAVTVVGLRAVGLILVVALLVIPAAAARFWTERLWVMTLLAGVIGAVSGYLGAAASALLPRFPAGAVIVLVAGAFFLVSLLLAPARGVVAAGLRYARLRLRVASQHLLRAVYEADECGRRESGRPVPLEELRALRPFARPWLRLVARWLELRGLVRRVEGGGVLLTDTGRRETRRVTRNHRLWEQFLVAHADLAPSHVDRSADLVEHVLSPAMVAELERQLTLSGRLPSRRASAADDLPPSAHPLATA